MYQVMLVDDDKALRYIYRKMKAWQMYGFEVVAEATNGVQALQLLQEHVVDIVFTDIRMPFMNGIELMKKSKEQFPDVSFVLISSYHEFEYAREGIREGALDYIVKPMTEDDLEHILSRIMGNFGNKESDYLTYFSFLSKDKTEWKEPVLQNLARYMFEHVKENVTLEEIADALQMNKDYLGKLIKKHTGRNYRVLYNAFKIEYSKPLIKSGKYKIYEISNMLGYSSTDYFTKQFRKYTDMTPIDFKKQK